MFLKKGREREDGGGKVSHLGRKSFVTRVVAAFTFAWHKRGKGILGEGGRAEGEEPVGGLHGRRKFSSFIFAVRPRERGEAASATLKADSQREGGGSFLLWKVEQHHPARGPKGKGTRRPTRKEERRGHFSSWEGRTSLWEGEKAGSTTSGGGGGMEHVLSQGNREREVPSYRGKRIRREFRDQGGEERL